MLIVKTFRIFNIIVTTSTCNVYTPGDNRTPTFYLGIISLTIVIIRRLDYRVTFTLCSLFLTLALLSCFMISLKYFFFHGFIFHGPQNFEVFGTSLLQLKIESPVLFTENGLVLTIELQEH